jgi:hypothetical protein
MEVSIVWFLVLATGGYTAPEMFPVWFKTEDECLATRAQLAVPNEEDQYTEVFYGTCVSGPLRKIYG